LLRRAEVVTATASQLHESLQPLRPDVILSPNAVDFSFMQRRLAETSAPPEELARFVQHGRRIVGYYGALAKWLDYALLADAAGLRPQYQFVLVGPEYDSALQRSRLLDLPNVSWLGARPYASLPAYLRYFDVAVIPFKLNAVTQAVSPIKLYEYLAAGKPVVATPTRECMGIAGVLLASRAEEFAARLDEALVMGAAPAYQAQAVQFAAENTWEARAVQLLAALGQPKSNA
jgi:glycosyltransferase involved in cell wall biosynthesis